MTFFPVTRPKVSVCLVTALTSKTLGFTKIYTFGCATQYIENDAKNMIKQIKGHLTRADSYCRTNTTPHTEYTP